MIQQSITENPQPIIESFAAVPGAFQYNGRDAGSIKIHESTISTIVKRTVLGIEGVSRLSGSSFIDNIAELVRSKKIQERSIGIVIEEKSVAVALSVNVLFGYPLPKLASDIQSGIVDAVMRMTGLTVSKVDVSIRDIEDPVVEEDEEDELESEK